MRLLLIRHGQTPSNVIRALDTGAPGPGLTELGLQQAAELVAALADEPIGALFASNLHRAQLTAAPLAEALGLEVSIREGLREIAAGCLEMRSDAESLIAYHGVLVEWMRGRHDARLDGGESCADVYARFNAVIEEAEAVAARLSEARSDGARSDVAGRAGAGPAGAGPDGAGLKGVGLAGARLEVTTLEGTRLEGARVEAAVAIVSHGAMIRAWCGRHASNLDADFVAAQTLANTGIVVLTGSSAGGWTVETWEGSRIA